MTRALIRRAALLLVLASLLVAPWSAAEPRQVRGATTTLLGQLWSQWIILWSEIGYGADPGGCSQVDIGCIMDPGGRCNNSTASQVEEIGCGLDPHEACGGNSAPSADIGCIMDPSGVCRH